jgi:hypothetical protein
MSESEQPGDELVDDMEFTEEESENLKGGQWTPPASQPSRDDVEDPAREGAGVAVSRVVGYQLEVRSRSPVTLVPERRGS